MSMIDISIEVAKILTSLLSCYSNAFKKSKNAERSDLGVQRVFIKLSFRLLAGKVIK